MLVKLNKTNILLLFEELNKLDEEDKRFFNPHEMTIESLNTLILNKYDYYYLYYDRKRFIGYGLLRTFGIYNTPSLGCIVWKKYRGKGFGDKLLKELCKSGIKLGFDEIVLKVSKDNDIAINMYVKNGFKPVKEENINLFMKKELN